MLEGDPYTLIGSGAINIYGRPDACTYGEQMIPPGAGGCYYSPITHGPGYLYTLPALVKDKAFFFQYQPPPGARDLQSAPFTAVMSIGNSGATLKTAFPTHGAFSAHVIVPNVGQGGSSCGPEGLCVSAPDPPLGSTAPPTWPAGIVGGTPPMPLHAPMAAGDVIAARAQGLFSLSDVMYGNADYYSPGAFMISGTFAAPPVGVSTASARACTRANAGDNWSCLDPTASAMWVSCASGQCSFSVDIPNFSTWTIFTNYPSSLPDLTPPMVSNIQVSPDGVNWSAPGTLLLSSAAYAQARIQDPSNGNEVVSGLVASTATTPFAPTSGLNALLRLDEGSGATAFDASGNGSTATMFGGTIPWAPGRFGSALSFDGASGKSLQITASAANFGSYTWTVGVWVNPNVQGQGGGILQSGVYGSNGYILSLKSGGQPCYMQTAQANGQQICDTAPLTAGAWSYLAATFDGTVMKLYVNGEMKASYIPTYILPGSLPFYIGAALGGSFNGLIDEMKVLSRAQAPEEIALDFRHGNAVLYTTDGWKTNHFAPNVSFGGAADGSPGPFNLTGAMTLAQSTSTNGVEFVVSDIAGHISSATIVVPVSLPDTSPPSQYNVQVSSDGSDWYRLGTVLPVSTVSVRIALSDPAINQALTSGLALSTAPAPPTLVPGTIMLMHFDEGSGGTATSVNSTPGNPLTFSVDPSAWTAGRFGGALSFAGSQSYSNFRVSFTQWTLSAWFKTNGITAGAVAGIGSILTLSDNVPGMLVFDQTGTRHGVWAPTAVSSGVWHFMAGSYDGTTVKLFVDGVLVNAAPLAPAPINNVVAAVGGLTGAVDELQVVDHALPDALILADYRNGYGANFSTDGGQTWSAPSVGYNATGPAPTSAVMTVNGLNLANSTTKNLLVTYALDLAGNSSSAAYVLPAGIDLSTPGSPVIVSTRLALGGDRVDWVDSGAEPSASYAVYRATFAFSSLAGLAPIAVTTQTYFLDLSASSDVLDYAVIGRTAQGGVSPPSPTVQIILDRAPPRTTLAVSGSTAAAASGRIYASSTSVFSLTSVDTGAVTSGVAAVSLVIDGTSMAIATAPFTLASGQHGLSYFASDAAGNVENAHVSTVAVDAAPPLSSIQIPGASYTDASGMSNIATNSGLSISAIDPGGNLASGVAATYVNVDSTSFVLSTGPVSLGFGFHQLVYYSIDNVGNIESQKSQSFIVWQPAMQTLSVSTINSVGLQASWNAYPQASSYGIYLSTLPGIGPFSQVSFTTTTSISILGLAPSTTYFARVQAFTPRGASLLSAAAIVRTPESAPSAVTDLSFLGVSASSVTLKWTAPAAASPLISYDLRRATFPITAVNFGSAFPVAVPTPASAGTLQTIDVANVTEPAFYAALVSRDSLGTYSALSNVAGFTRSTVTVNGVAEMSFSADLPVTEAILSTAAGPGAIVLASATTSGLSVLSNIYDLGPEGAIFNPPATLTIAFSSAALSAFGFSPSDVAIYEFFPSSGWVALPTKTLDATAQTITTSVSTLASIFALLGRPHVPPQLGLTPINGSTVTTATPGLSAAYWAAGLGIDRASVRLALDGVDVTTGAVVTISSASFTPSPALAQGAHVLSARVSDLSGNRASASSVFFVRSVPPVASLVFPSSAALAVEQTVGGVVSARGIVSSLGAPSWTLSASPGVNVSTGFSTVASGSTSVAGALGSWNTAGLSGAYTLKLAVVDSFGGAAVSSAAVYIGAPEIGFAIGGRNSNVVVRGFENPQGVVVRADGLIWASLDDDGRLLLLSSTGTVLKTIDRGLQHPRGLSLDATWNLYVADRNHDRVAEFDPDGSRLINEFKTGLKNPNDVAVDSDGAVYVADTNNHRVRVFSSSGTVLRDIVLSENAQPTGIALSVAGVWISDQVRKAAFLYTRQGILLKTLSGLGRVRGDAVDRGQSLYVIDRNGDRIDKFDPNGSPLLSFGARGDASPARRAALKFLNDPTDAALAPDGTLWVVDSGHDRLVRYVLPGSVSAGTFSAMEAAPAISAALSKAPAARNIDAVDGGKVERDDGTGVRVPPSALPAPQKLTVQDADASQDAGAKQGRLLVDKIQPVSGQIEYGPTGTQFQVPVMITLAYDPAQIALQGLAEDQLRVHYWNPIAGDWQSLDSVVNKETKTVSAWTAHFSVYQVMGPGIGTAAADPGFGLKAAYVFPNPVRDVGAVTIRIQPGLADGVEVHVYDVSGKKVHGSSDFSLSTLDDGNGLGTQYTYDHVWDLSGVGSGVYTYVLIAKKSGHADIHKIGRIGVVK